MLYGIRAYTRPNGHAMSCGLVKEAFCPSSHLVVVAILELTVYAGCSRVEVNPCLQLAEQVPTSVHKLAWYALHRSLVSSVILPVACKLQAQLPLSDIAPTGH